jgi:hypothetical protein
MIEPKERCECKEWSKWVTISDGLMGFLYVHGMKYPEDGPFFKFCPFCSRMLKDQETGERE